MKNTAVSYRFSNLFLSLVGWVTPICLFGAAGPLQLHQGQLLSAGDATIYVGANAIPCVTDWNGDGLLDVLIGYQPDGKILFFPNNGSSNSPYLGSAQVMKAAGSDIQHPSSGCGAPAPFVCDFDGDGNRDLLVGAGSDGRVHFYRNIGTDSSPTLTSGQPLITTGGTLNVGYRATPYWHDWDEDGKPDLLCGSGDGQVYFFKNTASATNPVYAASTLIKAGAATINLGYRSAVRVFDWDGDGVKDLVGTAGGNASWFRNKGSNSKPDLEAGVRLRTPDDAGNLALINTGARMRLDLADWNGDGVMDIMIGNDGGTVHWYEGYQFTLSAERDFSGNAVLKWNSSPGLRYNLLTGASVTNITSVLSSGISSDGRTSSWTTPLSAVQQFIKVQIAP